MIKEKNEETGEVKVIFSSEEFKKLKIFGGAAGTSHSFCRLGGMGCIQYDRSPCGK